jgi:purine-binding chemotaxis protein CheW
VIGYVTFLMDGRELAGRLGEVREVVRATGLEPLTGAVPPVSALLTLRGLPLPVVDLRSGRPDGPGDVLVLAADADGVLGIAVDRVLAVLAPDDLMPVVDGEPRPTGLPPYVREVRRDAAGRPVFVVELRTLAGLVVA